MYLIIYILWHENQSEILNDSHDNDSDDNVDGINNPALSSDNPALLSNNGRLLFVNVPLLYRL